MILYMVKKVISNPSQGKAGIVVVFDVTPGRQLTPIAPRHERGFLLPTE